ncbi:MAG: ROK family protein [Longimonas sp.]|uniref:ROK family protein n=1 Tax=Longimonas sp. TaxID=2039626 RepID=UPI003361F93F
MSIHAIGIDLGGTNIKAGLVEKRQGLVEQRSRPTEAERGPTHVLDVIAELTAGLSDDHDAAPIGIGIGSPGAINLDRTTVSHPPNLPGWNVIDVRKELATRTGLSHIVVENDANVAGLGCAHYGAGTAYDSFLMVTLGTGVGGAIIHQNKIFRGSSGGAGEIGHITIDYEGPLANSGVGGALEAYLGQQFLSQHARMRLRNHPDSLVYALTDGDLSALSPRILHEAATQGDTAAIDILAWAGHKLGCGLGSAVNLLDIRVIIVGGGVSKAGDFLLDPARKSLAKYVAPGLRDGLRIERERLGNEVGLLGAARLAFDASPTS